MSNGQNTDAAAPDTIYGLFAGAIDQIAIQRFHNMISIASGMGVKQLHLLFQSGGGIVGDGVSLYNLFRSCPTDVIVYNTGTVASIGTIAFLGAKQRFVSKYASFMIHRAYTSPSVATSERLSAAADQINMDDERIESILKLHTDIPDEKWLMHKFADVWISADDAIAYGMADAGEFAPPVGTKLFNVWPPQG